MSNRKYHKGSGLGFFRVSTTRDQASSTSFNIERTALTLAFGFCRTFHAQKFATFGDSVNCCFEILLGNIDVNTELRQLGGLQSIAGALFFWSYELLVFMVLLNFLLAIIVDAFSEVGWGPYISV